MRTRDVRVGETYMVEVPAHLPKDRYPLRTQDLQALTEWWQLQRLRGSRFWLTVTDLDSQSTPAMAEGMRVLPRSYVQLELTPEQARALGLPTPNNYYIQGNLLTSDGTIVELPDIDTLRLPTRWLHQGE